MIRQRYKKNDPPTDTVINQVVDSALELHRNHTSSDTTAHHSETISTVRTTTDDDDDDRYKLHHNYYIAILHFLSLSILIIGTPLTYYKLYTHVECDMTWSQREFIPIDIRNESSIANNNGNDRHHLLGVENNTYQFYKFLDQRDPRYKSIQGKSMLYANESSSWCPPSSHNNIVLYVPGHGGSYMQSRSLGAHGIQLTHQYMDRTVQQNIVLKLSSLSSSVHQQREGGGAAAGTTIDDFFFDVYAFDFNEEGGAFHGRILERQAAYIVHVVEQLTKWCPNSSGRTRLSIVAHSMGGISARLAVQQLSSGNNHNTIVQTVITLGTPHYMPVWNWGTSIHNVYHQLHAASTSTTTMISISGGLRDEMIPPQACYILDDHAQQMNVLTLLSTDLMIPPPHIEGKEYIPPYIGMDHRAIVWCHTVVSQVRSILFTLTHHQYPMIGDDSESSQSNISSSNRNDRRLHELRNRLFESSSSHGASYDYLQAISGLRKSLKTKYGWFTAFVMETSLIYNTEILVTLYAILGTVRYLDVTNIIASSILFPFLIGAVVFIWISVNSERKHLLSIQSMIVLAFVADAIFVSTRFLLHRYVLGSCHYQEYTTRNRIVVTTTYSIVTIMILVTFYITMGRNSWHASELAVAVAMIVMVVLLSLLLISITPKDAVQQSQVVYCNRQMIYIVLLLWMLPFVVFGDVYAIFKGIHTWGIYTTLFPILLRVVFAINYSENRASPPPPRHVLKVEKLNAVWLCRAIALPLCMWRLLSLDVHHHVIIHPIPMLIIVTTVTDILDDAFP